MLRPPFSARLAQWAAIRAARRAATTPEGRAYVARMMGTVRRKGPGTDPRATLHARATAASAGLYSRGAEEGDDDLCTLALLFADLRDGVADGTSATPPDA